MYVNSLFSKCRAQRVFQCSENKHQRISHCISNFPAFININTCRTNITFFHVFHQPLLMYVVLATSVNKLPVWTPTCTALNNSECSKEMLLHEMIQYLIKKIQKKIQKNKELLLNRWILLLLFISYQVY